LVLKEFQRLMNIEQIIARIRAGPNDIKLYPAATQSLLEYFEDKAKLVLPLDFKALYSFSNGFESAEDLFRIIPLDELMDDWHGENRVNGQFHFAEYLIYSDLWGVRLGEEGKGNYSIYYPESKQRKLFMTSSLAEFLGCFLNAGIYGKDGLYDWSRKNLPVLKP